VIQYTFSKQQRLLKPEEFKDVLGSKDKLVNSAFVLYIKPDTHARLGLAIAKKQVKKASHRNIIKRVVRESFRLIYPDLPAVAVIVMSRPVIVKLDKAELRRSIDSLWQQLLKKKVPVSLASASP